VSKPVALLLLSKPGCHLCDDARAVVEEVRASFAERGVAVAVEEQDILADPALARRHAEDIPVLFVNGRRHAVWRVDPERLTAAIERAAGGRMRRNRSWRPV